MTGRAASGAAGGSKLLGLEIIRFICAMTVIIWHFHHFAKIGDGSAMAGLEQPFEAILFPVYDYGYYSVQIFWAISGFIFYWKYADALAARTIDPKRFFWLRFSRLYPLHFVTLMTVAALQPIYSHYSGHWFQFGGGLVDFTLQLALADQWPGSRAYSFNGPIWSVSTEVLVYVAFFLLLRTFGKSPWIIVGAILASLASMWSDATSPAVICAGYFFGGGAAAQFLARDEKRNQRQRGRSIAWACLALTAATPLIIDLGAVSTRFATWLMFACPPILYLAAQDFRLLDRWQSAIQAAGNLTYSTYLTHFPMQLAVAIVALACGVKLPVGEAWFLLAYLAASLVIGRIVFVRFEGPVQDMIRQATLTPKRERAAV
ncbi:MAG: acyltransferase [Pseudomonadota bacterium]|nr:acyltransferase [Pseudomonadota bacterium]